MKKSAFHPTSGPISLAEIASALGLPAPVKDINLSGLAPLKTAATDQLSFLESSSHKGEATTTAGAVFVREKDAPLLPAATIAVLCENPYACFARSLALFHPQTAGSWGEGVSPLASVDPTAKLGKNVSIGPFSHIGPQVEIGAGSRIGANVTIICARIGKNAIIHPGARIGQDGFGFAREGETIHKIPQVGGVEIGDNVEIGANTTIDRGALENTIIGNNCKLDNQVQVAHNVRLGESCQVSGQVGIAGSAVIGSNVIIGGQVGINGHIEIADGVMIAARSGVTKSIATPGDVVSGFPAVPIRQWRRNQVAMARLGKKSC